MRQICIPSLFKTNIDSNCLCYVKEFINCEIRGSRSDAIVVDSVARNVSYVYRETKS